jgi:hypothetical protein
MTTTAAPRLCPDDCLHCWLRTQIAVHSCDGSAELVEQWLATVDANPRVVLPYLEGKGGFCSCEVLSNALDGRRTVLDDLVLACGS